jgi:hypothetical protein
MIRLAAVPVLLVASLLSSCEDPQVRDVKRRLVGTWVTESEEHGGVTRRVLTLELDGHTRETLQVVAATGASSVQSRDGEWFFDGVNLKRKYTYVDGKPLTNVYFIYETHELKSVTESEFVAASKVGRGEIRLHRAGAAAPQ